MFCWFQTNDARMAHTTTSRHIADHGTESFLKKYLDGSVKFILSKFCVFFKRTESYLVIAGHALKPTLWTVSKSCHQ